MRNDEEKISAMLGSLNKVDAPGDFDVRVRARIARGRIPAARSPLTWALSFGMPVLMVAAGGGYFAFYGLGGTEPQTASVQSASFAPVIEQPTAPAAPVNEARPTDRLAAMEPAVTAPEKADRLAPKVIEARPVSNRAATTSGSGSYDEAAREVKRILPRGFVSEPKLGTGSPNIGNSAGVSVKEVLELMGINAAFESGGWRVMSVGANDMAQRAGLKAGDVVEAIDGRSLTANTSLGASFTGSSLRVKRDGQTINIKLKP